MPWNEAACPRASVKPAANPPRAMSTTVSQSMSPVTVPTSVEAPTSAVATSIARARPANGAPCSENPTRSPPPATAMPPAISPVAAPIDSGMTTPIALRRPRAICSCDRSTVTANRRMRRWPTSAGMARGYRGPGGSSLSLQQTRFWCGKERLDPVQPLGLVSGGDRHGAVKGEWLLGAVGVRIERFEQEGDVVAGGQALEHAPGKPVAARLEHRRASRPLAPGALRELVDLVAGLRAEQLGQVGL